MKMDRCAAVAFALALCATSAQAQKTVITKRGGTASTKVTQSGKSVTGCATATSAKGNTVSAIGTSTLTRTGTSDSATIIGPKAGTTTATGTTTDNGTSTTANGTVTGPRGTSKTGTVVPR